MNSSFWILVCLEGLPSIHYENKKYSLKKGKTLLIPAIINLINIKGCGEIICITT